MTKVKFSFDPKNSVAGEILGWAIVLLISLKLIGLFTFSWWWVFSPIWLPIFIVFSIYLIISLAVMTIYVIASFIVGVNRWVNLSR